MLSSKYTSQPKEMKKNKEKTEEKKVLSQTCEQGRKEWNRINKEQL